MYRQAEAYQEKAQSTENGTGIRNQWGAWWGNENWRIHHNECIKVIFFKIYKGIEYHRDLFFRIHEYNKMSVENFLELSDQELKK